MAEYQRKPGDFVLFLNERKREGFKDPDFNGTFYGKPKADGTLTEFWYSGWVKKHSDHTGYPMMITGSIGKEKMPKGESPRPAGPPPPSRPAPPQRGPAPQQRPIQQKQVVQTDFGTVEGEVVEESPF